MKINSDPIINKIEDLPHDKKQSAPSVNANREVESTQAEVHNQVDSGFKNKYLKLQAELTIRQSNLTYLQILDNDYPRNNLSSLIKFIQDKVKNDALNDLDLSSLINSTTKDIFRENLTEILSDEREKLKALEVESGNLAAAYTGAHFMNEKTLAKVSESLGDQKPDSELQAASVLRLLGN